MKLSVLLFFLWTFAFSQFGEKDVVRWGGKTFVENGKTYIELSFNIDSEYHIYGLKEYEFGPNPTRIQIKDHSFTFVQLPPVKPHYDEGFEIDIDWISGEGKFILQVNKEVQLSELSVWYQPCTISICLPEKEKKVSLVSEVFPIPKQEEHISENGSLGAFIILSLGMGFLALLTPCVFPMIPITVSFFLKNSETSRWGAIKQGLIYGGGIVSTFTLIGFLIAFIFDASGVQNFAANPYVNLAIGLLFVVFALSLFGMFEIQLPSGFTNKVNALGMKPGNIGIIFAGIAFSLVTFTCSVPLVGTLLAQAALGDILYPIVGMLFFSMAFASPFVLLAIFPQLISQMPKSGGWLHATKIIMGFVEIAAAIKFFSQSDLVWNLELITRPMMLISWVTLFGMCGLYLLGMFKLSEEDKVEKIGIIRLFLSMVFIGFTLYLSTGINGKPLQADLDSYLPPHDYGVVSVSPKINNATQHLEEDWIEDIDQAYAESKQENRYIFVDFTGKTCTNCRWMEKNMFVKPEVQALMNTYVKTRLWTDYGERKEEYQKLQNHLFQSVALPYYAIMDSNGKVIKSFSGMTRDVTEFTSFLKL